MKLRLTIFALLGIAALSLAGCSTVAPAGQSTALLIQPLLDRIVPADFNGDGEFGERGTYLNVEVRVGGLTKTPAGWTWKWLSYRRSVSVPLAPGVKYQQDGWVTLGTPTVRP